MFERPPRMWLGWISPGWQYPRHAVGSRIWNGKEVIKRTDQKLHTLHAWCVSAEKNQNILSSATRHFKSSRLQEYVRDLPDESDTELWGVVAKRVVGRRTVVKVVTFQIGFRRHLHPGRRCVFRWGPFNVSFPVEKGSRGQEKGRGRVQHLNDELGAFLATFPIWPDRSTKNDRVHEMNIKEGIYTERTPEWIIIRCIAGVTGKTQ